MASLRFNYDGEKRSERGRPVNYEIMTRNGGFINRSNAGKRPGEVTIIPAVCDASISQATQTTTVVQSLEDLAILPEKAVEQIPAAPAIPIELPAGESLPEQDQAEQVGQTIPEANLSDSERLIARLESYESGVVKIRQQVDVTKVLFDEVLFHMDSFLKIMDVVRENEERKQREPQVSVIVQKTSKDTVDEVIDLLQTPTFQSILRQVLMGVFVKK